MNAMRDVAVVAETAAGRGERRSRRMLLLESTVYRDGLTPFTSVFVVSVSGELNEIRLHHALAQVQAKHPLLRCIVLSSFGGAMECCIISDEQSLPKTDAFAVQKRVMTILNCATGIVPQHESNSEGRISVEREATL